MKESDLNITDTERKELEELLRQKLIREVDDKQELVFKTHSALLMVSATVFAVLITLGGSAKHSICAEWLFHIAVIVNALTVLLFSLAVTEGLRVNKKSLSILRSALNRDYTNIYRVAGKLSLVKSVPVSKVFAFCEKYAYFSFVGLVIILIVYSFIK